MSSQPSEQAARAGTAGRGIFGVGLGLGLGLGAGLMYYLDPAKGRRRRNYVRDQALHRARQAARAINVAAQDAGNRTRGRLTETWMRFAGQSVSDDVLAERVRAEMGHVVHHPRQIEVAARSGRVTLGGPVPTDKVAPLLERVASVPGVASVENKLQAYEPLHHDAAMETAPAQ